MMDVHSKEIRSYNMSKIKGKDTKPEILVRKFLFAHGFRYRLHDKKLLGKPDIVLRKYNAVIFVHGCFWHGHDGCKKFVIPKTRTDFWLNKIKTNISNDNKNIEALKKDGWNVIIIWECEIKNEIRMQKLLKQIIN
ncbi:DNA mismatch endonuclease Vsr [Chryseobacterium sp. CKR4-1]|uniref:very short patch repair endonuclease n=1 Tax=Chryseobacterium sp. CKR4-1 TaxID=3068896 RepID=UPI002796BE0E|nr:DNA mismatch endonuclease Vsr [Chryseobacterium sp. CKR4-1]MDQ1806251.1 DNA mismatch endonuclease Vsr [Chryseobacterium sp. CKR4-1]